MAKAVRATLRTATDYWRACEPFDANGTLRGEFNEWPSNGRLNEDETTQLRQWADMARIAPGARFFVVFSYATPIAWAIVYRNGDIERYRVSQKFSVTTSKHQGRLY